MLGHSTLRGERERNIRASCLLLLNYWLALYTRSSAAAAAADAAAAAATCSLFG